MILVYHRIKTKINDTITIHPIRFICDMICILKNQVVFLEDYDPMNPNHVVLTFDDGYKDFLKYALPILKFFKYPFELGIIGDMVGKNGFLNEDDLKNIVKNGGRLQYHTKTHIDLTTLDSEEKIKEEIKVPEKLCKIDKNGFKFLFYPFWKYNDLIIDILKKENYKGALSGNGYGNKDKFSLERIRKG